MLGVGIANPLFFIGVVENNVDKRLEGRVQVRAFGVHGTRDEVPTDMLPWAVCVKGDYDPNGTPGIGLPALNSWVFGVFLDGRDCQQPMILGLIPTQYADPIDPDKNGWGVIPDRDGDILARGSTPEDVGEPQQDRLARGERIEETYVLQQEMGRTVNVKVGGTDESWDEPSSAYNAEYPYNRVFKTRNHSIELDDTPGAERIMIHHKSGSFIQIDGRGTVTEKTRGDKYEVNDRKQHVVVGGMSTVTILGNSYVYVKGNKIEEVEGDYQQLIHGNHLLSVGGQSTLQAAEQIQIRGADVKMQANVGTMAINAGKELQFSTKAGNYGAISIKSEKIMVDATDKLHLRGNTQVNIQAIAEMNTSAITFNQYAAGNINIQSGLSTLITSALTTDIKGGISLAMEGGVTAHVKAPFVYMDEYISMANGGSRSATPAVVGPYFAVPPVGQKAFTPQSGSPEVAWYAAEIAAPEPVAKSTSIVPSTNPGSLGSSGFSATDHSGETGVSTGTGSGVAGTSTIGDVSTANQSAAAPLLDFIGNLESDGYDDISGLIARHRYPAKPVTQMTIQEILDWQESIDRFQDSEAVGRYQFMEDTLRGYNNDRSAGPGNPLYARAGLSAGSLFNPENQDKMAIVLLNGRGLNRFLNGEISREQFANNLANEWASLPLVTGPNMGRSRYAGDSAGNRALTKVQEFLDVLDQVKAKQQAVISGSAG